MPPTPLFLASVSTVAPLRAKGNALPEHNTYTHRMALRLGVHENRAIFNPYDRLNLCKTGG